MKNTDTKKTAFNALDIAVILIVLVLIVTVIIRSGLAERLTFSGKDFTVTVRMDDTDGLELDSLKESVLYDADDRAFGTVRDIRYLKDGDGLNYMELDIVCNLTKKDGRTMNRYGVSVVPGVNLSLHSQLAAVTATVESVS